ncbi:MAG: hypothetical protein ACXWQ5_00695 [Ktedonobacterales bacterium]
MKHPGYAFCYIPNEGPRPIREDGLTDEHWRLRLSPLTFNTERAAYRWGNDHSDDWLISEDATTIALIGSEETRIVYTPQDKGSVQNLTLPTATFMSFIDSGYFRFVRYHMFEYGNEVKNADED